MTATASQVVRVMSQYVTRGQWQRSSDNATMWSTHGPH